MDPCLTRFSVAILALGVVVNLAAATAPASAGEPSWFFAPKEGMEPPRFGFSSGLSADLPIFGECGKEVRVQVSFERAALSELVIENADPSVNFVMDGEGRKVPIALLDFDDGAAQTWTPKISDLPKELFEKLAQAQKISIQLLAGDKVLDTYNPSSDRGRKKAMQRVAKECF